jgi:peptidoglycan/LPS O-acetylase OafA/YrhL
MEGLRGFAVFLVFIVHYATLVQPWISSEPLRALSAAMHAIGNTGVDLFFVLSGYLIYGSLMTRPQSFSGFMARRLRRIYPAFAVVFLIYVALSFVVSGESRIPTSAGSALVYLSANFLLLPGLFPIEPLITVAWSLSYEMFYYLSLPLLITALRLRQRSARWRVGFFGAVALVGLLLGATVGALALGAGAGLLVMLLPVSGPAGFATKIAVLFVAFFLLCLACYRPATLPLPRAFSWWPLRWLGNMSYSYYLLHGLALKAAFAVLGALVPHSTGHDAAWFWGLLPIMFGLTLIPTAALFLAVERPLSLTPTARR